MYRSDVVTWMIASAEREPRRLALERARLHAIEPAVTSARRSRVAATGTRLWALVDARRAAPAVHPGCCTV